MKKNIILVSILALACAASCTVAEDSSFNRTAAQLYYFSNSLTVASMDRVAELLSSTEDSTLLKGGWCDTVKTTYSDVRVFKSTSDPLDSTFSAVPISDDSMLDFVCTMKMKPGEFGFIIAGKEYKPHNWECEVSGTYKEEASGYSATFKTKDGEATLYSWRQAVSTSGLAFNIFKEGEFTVVTYLGTRKLDDCLTQWNGDSFVFTSSQGKLDSNSYYYYY